MRHKVWYRKKFQPFENSFEEGGGPWLVGSELTKADVVGAKANGFGALYMVITESGKHETIRNQQVVYSRMGNGKIKRSNATFPEFPFTNKRKMFWHFMWGAIGMAAFFLPLGIAMLVFMHWMSGLFLILFVIAAVIGNGSLNYKDYKEGLKYLKKD